MQVENTKLIDYRFFNEPIPDISSNTLSNSVIPDSSFYHVLVTFDRIASLETSYIKEKSKVSDENLKSSSIYLQIQESISDLENFYIFENPEQMKSFLMSNFQLINTLKEAPDYISKIFGKVKVSLKLHQDPEEDFEGLFIIIKTHLSPEESIKLLNRFDEEWWLNVDDEISNILEVMVRPI